ncbi:MAG TPA: response regulator [Noviherbaspirillum sp.]|jgi:CheY-like chemotaxis protein|uniref:response regulator n=1 Tax=Noviherbaspirillum sp. TaxID=1926288 RepID=UPI002DDDAA7F|nr:response regulator [Noviherbaspirillum sp.]HEV2609699.1 response regulator [Noviherbaspirillum sp.]
MVSSLRILVVEDNPESRDLLLEMIAIIGHDASAVDTAEDALITLQNEPFDVLLTDINLPRMSGLELAQNVVLVWPQVKIIFASGYGFLVIDNDRINFQFSLLSKPYSLVQLEDALARIAAEVFVPSQSIAS